jgi:hypothetical protein
LRQLLTPQLPIDGVFGAVGLLCTPYLVHPSSDPDLGRRVSEQTRREVARGESHLFYRFARAGAFAATDDGIDQFADWMATTPQNIAVSNVGVIDHVGDPAWVRSLTVLLSPSPNQVAFVSVTTYRDRLVMNVMTDRAKLSEDVSEHLVEGIKTRSGARDPGGPSVGSTRHPRVTSYRRTMAEVTAVD